jgi:hypothetical protein
MIVKSISTVSGNYEESIFPCDHTRSRSPSEDKIEVELFYRPHRKERHVITIPDDAEVVYLMNDRGDTLEIKRLNGSRIPQSQPKPQFRTG